MLCPRNQQETPCCLRVPWKRVTILHIMLFYFIYFFIDTFVSLAIPSLQLRLTTSLFSNLKVDFLLGRCHHMLNLER
jgi:hypothetical protein